MISEIAKINRLLELSTIDGQRKKLINSSLKKLKEELFFKDMLIEELKSEITINKTINRVC